MPLEFNNDPEIFSLIDREVERQNSTLQLIASENLTSPAVIRAMGSVLTNKYSEGYPGKRYYGGNEVVDEVEDIARERVKRLFGAKFANVQPHSGANANTAAYLALMKPGDTALGLRLDQGGHITHGLPVSISGQFYDFVSYGLTAEGIIDMDQVRDLAKKHKPKLIVAGATCYPRIIDPQPFREIADEVGAKLMFDAAHIAGLIAGGVHPSPVGIADVVTFTTHKTLRGPRGGCILTNDEELAKNIDRGVFPGSQGGPLDHVIAAKAVAFGEALQPSFKDYARQIVTNAAALAGAMTQEGFALVSGGTDNHLIWVDLRGFDEELTGKEAQSALDQAGISLNKNTVPDDPRSPFVTSGVRIGTPAVTTQGMHEPEMAEIASLIGRALRGRSSDAELKSVRDDVAVLCGKYAPYQVG